MLDLDQGDGYVSIAAGATQKFAVEIVGATNAADTTRTARVTDLEYLNVFGAATNPISSVAGFTNAGVPTAVSSYKY